MVLKAVRPFALIIRPSLAAVIRIITQTLRDERCVMTLITTAKETKFVSFWQV